jgi:hypothetical protein
MRANEDRSSGLEPWACERPRSDDALSELDAILEGPRPTVAQATERLEGLIHWARARSERLRGFGIEWTPAAERAESGASYRLASEPTARDPGLLRVRFRAVPARGVGMPLAGLALLFGGLLAPRLLGDPRWLGVSLLALVLLLAMQARESHELVLGRGATRLSRGVWRRETITLDPEAGLSWLRVNDEVWLVLEGPTRRVLAVVSPRDTGISVLPSLVAAFRDLERAHAPGSRVSSSEGA